MLVYILSYISAFLLSAIGMYFLSGSVLICASIYLYIVNYFKSKNIINLKGLFALSFVGGQGISCLKLSKLQGDWELLTWLCLFFAFLCFYLGYELIDRFLGKERVTKRRYFIFNKIPRSSSVKIYYSICIITAVSLASFLIEAFMLGYVPLFVRGVPHAYSEFHISGLHYFTVSCVLVPSLAIIYFDIEKRISSLRHVSVLVSIFIALMIPILSVSRFQFIFSILVALFVLIFIKRDLPAVYIFMMIFLMIPVYIILTIARSHDAEYLNSIFQMKYRLPIFISQPYIYIANNYDNLDYLISHLSSHSMGFKILFPLWALSGLKFVYPWLVDFPIYVNKAELTTVTLFYDVFYDFGVIGVMLFGFILGIVCNILDRKANDFNNIVFPLFYAQMALYMGLAFFTTWFSNPTTWFYFAITFIITLLVKI